MKKKNFTLNPDQEWLTDEIACEYFRRARSLNDDGSDVGARRELRLELMKRCGVTELEAVNILKGCFISDYVSKYEIASGRRKMQIDKKELERRRKRLLKQLDESEAVGYYDDMDEEGE